MNADMEKRTVRNWLRWFCVGLLCVSGMGSGVLQAEGVPPVIKYQAVLRNVEGEPMVERTDLAVRITLRQGSPAGTILYQETHTDLTTDAFGLLLLEIGRGQVSNAGRGSLAEVPWKNSPIYAQVEIQADDNGYTMMGASELLSVPYALYAGDAGVGLDLADGYVPRYDADQGGLVNSGISQFNDKITFSFENGDDYTFPTTRGKKGEVLMLTDEHGTLDWGVGGGGGGGADCADCDDLQFVYWDATANKNQGALRTADMYYDDVTGGIYIDGAEFSSREATRLEGTVVVNATVSGDNNLQYNGLPQGNVWVGGADNKSRPYGLGTGVSIDSTDKTKPVLNFGGGVWDARTDANAYYVYTKDEDYPGKALLVGVGTGNAPKARFHVQGGSFLLSETVGATVEDVNWTAGNHFYWHSGKGALRMGKLEDGSSLWADLAENSIALGTGAKARETDNVAIGKGAEATEPGAMVFGQTARADGITALALGTNIKVSGPNAIGIGSGYSDDLNNPTFLAEKAYDIAMGYDVKISSDRAIGIGQNNEIGVDEPYDIVLGADNANRTSGSPGAGGYNITIGTENKTTATGARDKVQGNVLMGQKLEVANGEKNINFGFENSVKGSNCISFGRENTITAKNVINGGICIGRANTMELENPTYSESGPILLGYGLTMHDKTAGRGVILGQYNAAASGFVNGGKVALMIGVGENEDQRQNALELSDKGELKLAGDVRANTIILTSDSTLKTDIQPLDADYTVLQALQPVRYRFKADETQALQFGFIAQDVESYFPHLVHTDGKGLKSLNYTGLLPVLWQYTQRLEQTVETQAAEIDRLKTELESLKADVQAIKAAVGMGE